MRVSPTFNHIMPLAERIIVLPYSLSTGLKLHHNSSGKDPFIRAKRHSATGFWYTEPDMDTGIIVFVSGVTDINAIPTGYGVLITHKFRSGVAAKGVLYPLPYNVVSLKDTDARMVVEA